MKYEYIIVILIRDISKNKYKYTRTFLLIFVILYAFFFHLSSQKSIFIHPNTITPPRLSVILHGRQMDRKFSSFFLLFFFFCHAAPQPPLACYTHCVCVTYILREQSKPRDVYPWESSRFAGAASDRCTYRCSPQYNAPG